MSAYAFFAFFLWAELPELKRYTHTHGTIRFCWIGT